MHTRTPSSIAAALVAGLCVVAATSTALAADDSVTELHVIKSGGRTMIAAFADDGVTFLDVATHGTYRAWPTSTKVGKGARPDFFVLRDADKDGVVDVLVMGNPAFIISGIGDPISSVKGKCDQVHMNDFAADGSVDVLCRKGNTITLTTHDGQKLWEYKVSGITINDCHFGDFNGNLKADIECAAGKGRFVRIGGDGNELGRDFDSAQLDDTEDDNPGHEARSKDVLAGREMFDIDGDGTAEESLNADGKMLFIRSGAKPKPLGQAETGPLFSALVEDLDGDGAADVVVGGAGKVFFFGRDGKLIAEVTTDPKKLHRDPAVEVEGVGANGLEDDSGEVNKKVVVDGSALLASCYGTNVKRDPYTRVGRVIYNLDIDAKGGVKRAQRLHSDLDDKSVEGCLSKAFTKLKFGKASQPGASVTVTLKMGFVDR